MSFEAITSIAQAEEAAKVAVAYAQQQAKQMIADAEAKGKESVAEAVKKAENELLQLKKKTEEKASESAEILYGEVGEKKSALRAMAESKLDEAANLIVERIVNG